LFVGANSEIGGGARDSLGFTHITQPLRFRGFEALPKGANPVGATTVVGTKPHLRDLRHSLRRVKRASDRVEPGYTALRVLGLREADQPL
jgi:hypothetical protein